MSVRLNRHSSNQLIISRLEMLGRYRSNPVPLRTVVRGRMKRQPAGVRCVVNVDGSGESRTVRVYHYGFEGVVETFEAAADRVDAPLETRGGVIPRRPVGVRPARRPRRVSASTSNLEGRGWTYTHADTLDKVNPRDLRELSLVLTVGVGKFARGDTGVLHRSQARSETPSTRATSAN